MVERSSGQWQTPPLLKFRSRPPLCTPFKYIFGTVLTIFVSLFCLISLPLVLLLRLICILRERCRRRRIPAIQHCELHWPSLGSEPARAVITLHTQIDPNVVALQLNRILSQAGSECCSTGHESNSSDVKDAVVIWDQSKTRLRYVDDLLAVLNDPGGLPPADCSVVVVQGFENTRESPTQDGCLLVVSLRPRTHSFCLPRLLTMYSAGQLVFEVEPRMSRPFMNSRNPRLHMPVYICNGMYHTLQFICRGPLSVLCNAFTRTNPVWKALGSEKPKKTGTKKRKPVRNSITDDDSTLMHSALEEIAATPKSELAPKISNVSSYSSSATRSVSWMRVAHCEHLGRAERLLRAATVELLTALVSGALRQHFREQGIRHPPDVGGSVAVSCRDFVPVEAQRCCEAVLLPISLPTSVEGAIPRAWAVQRRMAKVLDGVMPNALKISQFISSVCCPPSLSESLSSALYGDNAVHVSFMRAGGELSLDGARMQSLLFFPPVAESVLASFCFVQSGSEMMLSVSLDKNVFPRPSTLLAYFKCEVQNLIEQLSMRLLTLSQATFLPERMPFLRVDSEDEEYCRDSEVFARNHFRGEPPVTPHKPDSEYTLEELQELLTTVQDELDGMRANPQGDRMEYIRKLTELENRMQRFHECITQKLGSGISELVNDESNHVASTAVAELLAPYRQESGMTGRRFSREYIRTDSSSSRKNSRTSF